jgi:hypothetical protein
MGVPSVFTAFLLAKTYTVCGRAERAGSQGSVAALFSAAFRRLW